MNDSVVLIIDHQRESTTEWMKLNGPEDNLEHGQLDPYGGACSTLP